MGSEEYPPGLRQCFGKKRYRTIAFVEKVIAKAEAARGVKLRYYYCGMCDRYHLTKKPAETK